MTALTSGEVVAVVLIAALVVTVVAWLSVKRDRGEEAQVARIVYEVRYTDPGWSVYRAGGLMRDFDTKDEAVRVARRKARLEWEEDGHPTEVIIKTRSGRIGRGEGSRSSYGRDPVASKG